MAKKVKKGPRVRKNYTWYRCIGFVGTKRTSEEFPSELKAFLEAYAFKPDNPMWKNCFHGVRLSQLRSLMNSIPQSELPWAVEVRDPVGNVVYRWSRVSSWSMESYKFPSQRTGESVPGPAGGWELHSIGDPRVDSRPRTEVCQKR